MAGYDNSHGPDDKEYAYHDWPLPSAYDIESLLRQNSRIIDLSDCGYYTLYMNGRGLEVGDYAYASSGHNMDEFIGNGRDVKLCATASFDFRDDICFLHKLEWYGYHRRYSGGWVFVNNQFRDGGARMFFHDDDSNTPKIYVPGSMDDLGNGVVPSDAQRFVDDCVSWASRSLADYIGKCYTGVYDETMFGILDGEAKRINGEWFASQYGAPYQGDIVRESKVASCGDVWFV